MRTHKESGRLDSTDMDGYWAVSGCRDDAVRVRNPVERRDVRRGRCPRPPDGVLSINVLHVSYAVAALLFLVVVILSVRLWGYPPPRVTLTDTAYLSCHSSWITYRGKCLYVDADRLYTWNDSIAFCERAGAQLATFDDNADLDFMFATIDLTHHWIGLYRSSETAAWTWINGTRFHNSTRTVIRGNEPYVYLQGRRLSTARATAMRRPTCMKPQVARRCGDYSPS
nr:protein b169 [Mastomys natalensis cytomegalovirus 3]WEG70271.1 protein b169 [Mastomys natalensis cytomegalovirus 3]WEG70411.1 protein b169 [Mastomys natalensis cytomegalovirus 3]WEG70551.1 protein b169 [Mastomys natalensis cytomegalovirus 3]WEG70831.1 protein b169 [Mastomys natalensis cytomegalovirus 3]